MSNLLKTAIVIVDIIIFFLLLCFLPFEHKVNSGLAILIFAAVLWLSEALHVTITSILIPVLAIGTGLLSTKNALANFADPNIFLFFGGFALAAALHFQQIDKIIAQRLLYLAKGNFALSVLSIFLATAFLSMWMSNTATAAMMLPLTIGILSKIDANRNTYVFVLLGIAFSANIGGIGTLVGTPPNSIVASNLGITFAQWLWYGIPVVLLFMPLMIAVLYFVLRPKLNYHIDIMRNDETIKMNSQRYITLAIFAFIACCWIFSAYLEPFFSALAGLEKISSFDSVIALLAAILVCSFRVVDWKTIQKNTDWGVLMLFGGGITLSFILKDSGASKVMADGMVALVKNTNLFFVALLVSLFIVFLTEFTSNTASASLLVPFFISIADSLGVSSLALALIIGIGASCAFMLPVATPPNALVFGTGYIQQTQMIKVGIYLNIFCSLIIAILAYFFWF
ncbi:DASS family sodium-coupled anion symporter [Campylobacter sp. MIT 21-1685]|uniref:SLC13 family permease n=1 Tax=unclassified Campylobacter TaxID=2593542 RepID=UPI00224AAF13|nr:MULTISPECIES: DASS family sodium-coupled anion symporter [unclassified Campylobacter]MCX2682303.1 DASS family sodium-coupled anion symporter [Campylobacter sp. MIT 21-1684]MCX2750583.1 DASS family sodium-coupled anion symporter [Campylobacter sp. MIT 21-1682]MCX2806870.1 DASS family sodium-coupled anion symporter [Campylobacter sp. MIT 21-1685]